MRIVPAPLLPVTGAMQVLGSSGLENETVVGCAASRYFSVVVTAKGEVWTYGACYNGSLGSDLSWSTSAQVCWVHKPPCPHVASLHRLAVVPAWLSQLVVPNPAG